MDVIGRIQGLMQVRGWTEYRLTKETRLPPSTIANIFHRGTTPSISTLEKICEAFGISLSQFFAEGSLIALTAEQEDLLDKWSALSRDQKDALLVLMSKMDRGPRS